MTKKAARISLLVALITSVVIAWLALLPRLKARAGADRFIENAGTILAAHEQLQLAWDTMVLPAEYFDSSGAIREDVLREFPLPAYVHLLPPNVEMTKSKEPSKDGRALQLVAPIDQKFGGAMTRFWLGASEERCAELLRDPFAERSLRLYLRDRVIYLVSDGPDSVPSVGLKEVHGNEVESLTYDPTNGILSAGDLVLSR